MFRAAVLAALFLCVHATFYTDCGSKLANLESVAVSGCLESAEECVLKRGTNVTFDMIFTPSAEATRVDTVVHGIIMNLPVPFPLPNPDACKDGGLSCPLKPSEKVSYHATLPVLKSYPKVTVDVKWELQNEKEEDLVCILIKARLR